MTRRNIFGETANKTLQDLDLRDDFELDELEEEEEITVYDIDPVLGYTVDIFKLGFPFMFLLALFMGLIMVAGVYL